MKRLAMIGIALCLAIFIATSAIVWWHHWHDRVLAMTELASFTIDQTAGTTADVPRWIRRLDGQHVALIGEIWQPTGEDDKMQKFDLTDLYAKRSPWGPPRVQEFVHCRPTTTALKYQDGLVRVSGTLHVRAVNDSGQLAAIFTMDADEVSPAVKPLNWEPLRWSWLAAAGVLAILLYLATWYERFIVQRRRARRHLCPKCGYDLRATPARCPECGHVMASDWLCADVM